MMIRLEPQMINRHDIIVVDSKNRVISDRRLIRRLDRLYKAKAKAEAKARAKAKAFIFEDSEKLVFDDVTVLLKAGNRTSAFVKLERSNIPELLFEQFSIVIRF